MKKIVILGLLGLMCLIGNMARAQFGDYGVRFGLGHSTIEDDITTESGLLGVGIGGYINYHFTGTVFEEFFYLQSGININRRGCSFLDVFENGMTYREGYIHAWYAQIPILVGVHFELPIREVGHTVGFFLGPAFNIGLFGPYSERKITPFVSAPEANYDLRVNGTAADRDVFSHINRFDLSAMLGLTYERGPLTYSVFIDRGLLATSTGVDVLRVLENNLNSSNNNNNGQEINVNIPNGNNLSYMFAVSYKLGSLTK